MRFVRSLRRAVVVVAVVAAASLLAGDLPLAAEEVTPPVGQVGVEFTDGVATDLPVPASPPVPGGELYVPPAGTQVASPAVGAGDEGSREAGLQPGAQVVEESISSTSRVFENPDGSFTAEVSAGPVRVERDGRWVDIDLSPRLQDDGSLVPVAAVADVSVPADPAQGSMVLETAEGRFVAGYPDVVSPVAGASAIVVDDGVELRDVEPGSAVSRVVFDAEGLKQDVVWPSPEGARPSYLVAVSVPDGVSARETEGGNVDFVDSRGRVVAEYRGGVAFDATGWESPASVRLREVKAGLATLEVAVDAEWFAAARFPVTIDPSLTSTGSSVDTTINQGYPSANYSNDADLRIGRCSNGCGPTQSNFYTRRGLLYFDLGTWPTNRIVLGASIDVFNSYSTSCSTKNVQVLALGGPFTSSTSWSNQPGVAAAAPVEQTGFANGYSTSCPGSAVSLPATNIARWWLEEGNPNYGVMLKVPDAQETANSYYGNYLRSANYSTTADRPVLRVDFQTPPPAPTAISPLTNVVLTAPPTSFSVNAVSDPDGDVPRYYLRVATGADAETGDIVYNSGWQTSTTFDTAAALRNLQDGTYYWHVWSWDNTVVETMNPAMTPVKFVVKRRLGADSTSPMQELGPVSVNLATGNATTSFASPSIATLGGSVGVSLSYNSLAPAQRGLAATYYRDTTGSGQPTFTGAFPVLQRVDPTVRFSLGAGSPDVGVPADRYLVRWTGTITFPSTPSATWEIGADNDDGLRIDIGSNGSWDLNDWSDQGIGDPDFSTANWSGSQPLTIEYYENMGGSAVNLLARPSGSSGLTQAVEVPTEWLAPTSSVPMPPGWSISADLDGGLAFTSARVETNRVVLLSADGGSLEYTRTGTALTPPPGEDGILAYNDGDGTWSYSPGDGSVYVFNNAGALVSRLDAVDDRSPAAPIYTYTGNPPRLTTITDRVSSTELVKVVYGGDTGTGNLGCAVSSSKPSGMLCRIVYHPGTADEAVTELDYSASQLASITDPGGEVTQLGYDSNGRLVTVRDSLGAAVAAAVPIEATGACDLTCTRIDYYSDGRVWKVTAPDPDWNASTGVARGQVTVTYTDADTTTVAVAGSVNASGWTRQVDFDSGGRLLVARDQAGVSTSQAWMAADRDQLAWSLSADPDQNPTTADPGPLEINYHYDHAGRVDTVWGPALDAWVIGSGPAGADPVPTTSTAFDQNLTGLAAEYWERAGGAGTARVHTLGIDGASPADMVWRNWGSAAPVTGMASDNWQLRLTGEILFTADGQWQIQANRQGRARVWIDGALVADGWTQADSVLGTSSVPFTVTNSTVPKRIQIDYADTGSAGSAAQLTLSWKPPGGSLGDVPGSALRPRYGLATSRTDPDGRVTTTAYSNASISPAFGLATSTTVDPSGLALTTSTGYETPGSGFLRRVSRTLPSGDATTYEYWGATETAAPPSGCPSGSAVPQRGALRRSIGPDPDGAGAGKPRIQEYVYDRWGRTIATRVGEGTTALGSEPWSCVTYDARGRVAQSTQPAYGNEAARTITNDYTADATPAVSDDAGYPHVASLNDAAGTIYTTVDLLGRVTAYTDVWGNTTTTSYDQAGRVTQSSGPGGTTAYSYDTTTGRMTSLNVNGGTAELDLSQSDSYDLIGRPSIYRYSNTNRSAPITYDDYGRQNQLRWNTSTGTLVTSDEVTRTLGGNIVNQLVDGVDPYPAGNNFVYDQAGRLTSAHVYDASLTGSDRAMSWSYSAPTSCSGHSSNAYKNTNRTAQTDNGVTTTYCYDHADRLVDTNTTGFDAPVYDDHGNTISHSSSGATEYRTYDWANRHLGTCRGVCTGTGTTVNATAAVRYQRDATDRIISSTSNVTVRGKTQVSASSATSITVTAPSGTQPGDLLVAHIAATTDTAVPTPSGWTAAGTIANGTAVRTTVFWRIAATGDPASWSFALGATRSAAGGMTGYIGADPVTPLGATTTATATSTSPAIGGLTTTRAASQVYIAWGLAGNVSTTTGPVNMTKRSDSSAGSAVRAVTYDQLIPADNLATGTRTLTNAASSNAAMIAVQINPLVVRYGSSATGDTPEFTQYTNGAVIEQTLALPGGALLTRRGTNEVWTLPNLHGDAAAITDATGAKYLVTLTWDPYGNQLVGTPDNSTGTLDYGWLAQHQRPAERNVGLTPVIEMGARQYSPLLGRFLEVDPLEGGCANDYAYPGDPVSKSDLDGRGSPRGRSCRDLRSSIYHRMSVLTRRFNDLRANRLNLPLNGRNSIVGHRTQFQGEQTGLRTELGQYDNQGCGPPPAGAWRWATAQTPWPRDMSRYGGIPSSRHGLGWHIKPWHVLAVVGVGAAIYFSGGAATPAVALL